MVEAIVERYRSSCRADKQRILDEFVAFTGYHRKHAIRVLRRLTQALAVDAAAFEQIRAIRDKIGYTAIDLTNDSQPDDPPRLAAESEIGIARAVFRRSERFGRTVRIDEADLARNLSAIAAAAKDGSLVVAYLHHHHWTSDWLLNSRLSGFHSPALGATSLFPSTVATLNYLTDIAGSLILQLILETERARMVRRKSHISDYCPSARSLDVIGDWWSLLIVRDAFDGVTRFGEFQKSLGIARNILTARLRTLVDRGILEAVPISEGGARQEYRLTQMGRDLFPVMVALRQFGERHLFAPNEKRSKLVERSTGRPIRLDVLTEDGRPVNSEETVILKISEDLG